MAKRGDGQGGYGNPPEKHQFKKGRSGNPNGRPRRKAETELEMKKRVFAEPMQLSGGTTITKGEYLFRIAVNKMAQKGDVKGLLALMGEIHQTAGDGIDYGAEVRRKIDEIAARLKRDGRKDNDDEYA